MSEAELSVIIGTYNRLDVLKKSIASICDQSRREVRVYVTDAGSTDGTIEYLKAVASDTIIPILEGRKLGQARALNEAIRGVTTPFVCWLSDDNLIVNRGLDTALRILERHRSIGMVALKVKDVQGPFVDAPYIGGISPVGILNVNQGMLPTDLLRRVGGFSEHFVDYGIDADLTAKVLLSGYRIAYTKKVAIHHYRQWASDKTSPEYRQLLKKHDRCRALYDRKYGVLGTKDRWWEWKKKAWIKLEPFLKRSPQLCSESGLLGMNERDWKNIFHARYISLLDFIRHYATSYHLVQRCPRWRRPRELPPDPLESA